MAFARSLLIASQPRSFLLARERPTHLNERLEDRADGRLGYVDARVPHVQLTALPALLTGNLDHAARIRELHRVGQQIDEDLFDLGLIALHVSAPAQGVEPERLAVEIRGTVRQVLVQDVNYITSDGPYAALHVGGRRHLIRETMQTLEERLDPAKFMRVHRSVIVRLALIESLERGAEGDGELILRGRARLRVSRTRREALERWLGLAR